MFVGGVVVEDDMDQLASRDLALDGIEKADEFNMAVALHAASDHGAVEHAERGEQGGGAVPLVIMHHGLAAPGLDRQSGLARRGRKAWETRIRNQIWLARSEGEIITREEARTRVGARMRRRNDKKAADG